jgi:hypothetical protein
MQKEENTVVPRSAPSREEGPPEGWYDEAEAALGLTEHEALTALRRLPPVRAWQVFCESHNTPDPLVKLAQEVARLQALYVSTGEPRYGWKAETLAARCVRR